MRISHIPITFSPTKAANRLLSSKITNHQTCQNPKMADQNGLKKLNFVPEYGTKGYTLATNAYSAAKDKLPVPVQDQLASLETTVTSLSSPYIAKAQDKGTEILKLVDDQVSLETGAEGPAIFLGWRGEHVPCQLHLSSIIPCFSNPIPSPHFICIQIDSAVQSAGQVYQKNSSYIQTQLEKSRELHKHNLESYKAAKEQYLKKVEESVEFVKTNGISGAARKAADEVSHAVTEARKLPGAVLKQVHDTFERLLTFEPVQKALSSAKPTIDAAYTRYLGVHDTVVASPQYKRAFDLSQAAVARAQETFFYKKAVESLYPLVSKYADPAVAQLTASPYYQAAVAHVLPKAA